jgi:uncharacterized membrane protein YedE/YeeE
MNRKNSYMNPYLAGVLLGFVLLVTIYITGRGLGASGAMKSLGVASVKTSSPAHFESTAYYQDYEADHPEGLLKSWLVFEMLGVLIGAFLSGALSGRLGLKLEKGPGISNPTRIIGAILGGFLFGFGSQLGRGCTSGAALSGMAVMSFGGIITMLAIFGGAYAFAWFFKRLWLTR